MNRPEVVIASVARTPIGSFQGSLSSLSAPQLGAIAIRAAVERADLQPTDVEEVIMGQVLTAGAGQAPARQAALEAGLPNSVPCATVNKVCGSGLYSVMQARRAISLGEVKIIVAGGMESMSNAPFLLPGARQGFRLGDQKLVDAMIHDGLWDPYSEQHMGNLGELCARDRQFSRKTQDEYATRSYERALAAKRDSKFASEIVPVQVTQNKKEVSILADEEVLRYAPGKIEKLKPVFDADGTITAANASKLSDGAAAIVMMNREEAERRDCPILATWVADATFAQDPAWFTTAPAQAIRKVVEKAEISLDQLDLFEINEAFAVVVLATLEELKLDKQRVNVHGGAISLGHPIGCSGTRTLVTLCSAMQTLDCELGCVSLCLGGGEAVAAIIRRERK